MDVLEPATKAGIYAALFIAIGAAAVRVLCLGADVAAGKNGARARSLALTASLALVLMLGLRLLAHTLAAFGADELSWSNLRLMAIESRWSSGWRTQAAAALGCAVTAPWLIRRPIALVVALLAAALALPLTGHAAGSMSTRWLATAHLLGGGVWIGTLAALVIMKQRGPIWSQFSQLAMVGAAMVTLSGLVMATIYLPSWRDLLDTPYGMVLVAKMALFLGIVACGFLNWRRIQRPLVPAAGPPYAAFETALALGLLFVTAFLSEIAHP